MYLADFRARIERLRAMTAVVRVTKKHPWGHEPGLLAIRFFDWETAKKLRKEFIESYEGYTDDAKLTANGEWIRHSIVPFAIVAGSPSLEPKSWPDSEVLADAAAFLFFDASRENATGCPVMMATPDSFKLREVAPSLEELGVVCVGPSWKPSALVVLG
jgi:hypothetical protein